MNNTHNNPEEYPEGIGSIGHQPDVDIIEHYDIPDNYNDDVSDSADKIISHFMFHRALNMDDPASIEKLNHYIELIKEYEDDGLLYESDPCERSIRIALELVRDEQMDPWDIDLIKFAEFYIKKIHSESLVNLPSVGRVIYLAWILLTMKSENLLTMVNQTDDVEEDDLFDPMDDYMLEDDDYMFLESLRDKDSPLSVKLHRKSTRPVTLIELLSALEDANKEVARNQEIIKKREQMRRAQKNKARTLISDELHQENIEEEKKKLLDMLRKEYSNGWTPMKSLLPPSWKFVDELRVFILLLHLHKDGNIRLLQKDFPYGDIMFNIAGTDEAAS